MLWWGFASDSGLGSDSDEFEVNSAAPGSNIQGGIQGGPCPGGNV